MAILSIEQLKKAAVLLALTALAACGGSGDGGGACVAGQVQQNGQCVTRIGAPTGVTASAGEGLVTISWPAVAGASSYNLYKAAASGVTTSNYGALSAGGRLAGVASPVVVTGLTNGTTYYFVVTAVDANGESVDSSEVAATPQTAVVGRLNDTGISQCNQLGNDELVPCSSAEALALSTAQDGMIGRDANPATNGSADGRLGFSFARVDGGCVLDNVTGLMWEVKTADGGLRDWNLLYTNYGDGRAWDASAYTAAVNATNLCGHDDWRLPTLDELVSIVDYSLAPTGLPSRDWPAVIDASWFVNTAKVAYWTSSYSSAARLNTTSGIFQYDAGTGNFIYAKVVYFGEGTVASSLRSNGNAVRLVRGGPSAPAQRFSVSADGLEVTDNQTHLIWRRCVEGVTWDGVTCAGTAKTFIYEGALLRAASQVLTVGKAWRLPNVKELASIADRGRTRPAIDPVVFPATPASNHWSSTPGAVGSENVWQVEFSIGDITWSDTRHDTYHVRLVRAGP